MGCGLGGVLAGPLLDAVARAVPREEPVLTLRRPDRLTVAVAVVTGVLAALVALAYPGSWLLPAQLWLLALAVVLTLTDVQHRRLPNVLLLPGGAVLAVLLAAGAVVEGRGGDLLGPVLTAAVLFTLFLLAAVVSPSGMGMGDVKLAGVLGLALGLSGPAATVLAVLVAFALHAVLAVVLLVTRRAGRRTALPFGPALLAGTGLALGWFSPLVA